MKSRYGIAADKDSLLNNGFQDLGSGADQKPLKMNEVTGTITLRT
jgi:hypothetical protein